jgi:hypothetical protein
MLKATSIALAGALGFALLAGPLDAQDYGTITLRVPVQLKKMLAEQVQVSCRVYKTGDPGLRGEGTSGPLNIVNGEFNEVIEVRVTPTSAEGFRDADHYYCNLYLPNVEPHQGTPPSGDIKLLAKPDEFFRAKTNGKVGVGGPKGGPKDFKGQKQP